MLMSELIAHVQSLVIRPDLAGLLALRTVQAVRALHQYAEYIADVREIEIPPASITFASGSQSIGTFQLSMDVRRPVVLEGRTMAGIPLSSDYKKISIAHVGKLRRARLDNFTFYQTGNMISFKGAEPVHSFVLAYVTYAPPYANIYTTAGALRPTTDPLLANYTDWLMQNHTLAVMDFAVAYVAAAVGDLELASTYNNAFASIHQPILAALPTI